MSVVCITLLEYGPIIYETKPFGYEKSDFYMENWAFFVAYDIIINNGDEFMKTPLRFQVTEYDCGTVSLYNVISYLFEREEIPAQLLKTIHKYTLDCYDENGNPGQGVLLKKQLKKLLNL